jgi:hypothetical protein
MPEALYLQRCHSTLQFKLKMHQCKVNPAMAGMMLKIFYNAGSK